MVEVGTLEIGAKINTREIDRGTDKIKQDMSQVQAAAASTTADIDRTEKSTSRLGKGLAFVGSVGSGVMLGLAAQAPAVAGSMARIKVETEELSRNLGSALKPAFDFAADSLDNINQFAQETPGVFQGVVGAIGALSLDAAIKKVFGVSVLKTIGTAIAQSPVGLFVGSGLALLGGGSALAGIGIGAGVGAIGGVGAFGATKLTDILGLTSQEGGLGEAAKRFGAGAAGGAGAGALTGAAIGALGGPIGATAGAIIGALGGLIFAGIQEYKINRRTQEQNIQFLV